MQILRSQVSPSSAAFRENAERMRGLVADMADKAALLAEGGTAEARTLHVASSKLLPRERLAALLDVGSPFLEIGQFAGWDIYENSVTSAGLIAGIARIAGRQCMIIADNPTVKGGTHNPLTIKKHLRAQEIALENNLPCIYLVDPGGANLSVQEEAFSDHEHFGRILYNQAIMSARGIPQIACATGSSVAGAAYVPAMSDETVIVRDQGTAEEFGGADHYAQDDRHALSIVRRIVKNLNRKKVLALTLQKAIPPLYDPHELYGIVPTDPQQACNVREVIARLVDGSEFDEFRQSDGATLVTGIAHLHGMPVGILANNGTHFSESASKGAHFIQLCCQRKIPLLFLQNTSGFMPGQKHEPGTITRDSARLLTAVATARVPKITTIIGSQFGTGSYSMCGRAFSPRFLWTWPNARIPSLAPVPDSYEHDGHPLYASARLWNDGIIDPARTRETLALSLSASLNAPIGETSVGVWRM